MKNRINLITKINLPNFLFFAFLIMTIFNTTACKEDEMEEPVPESELEVYVDFNWAVTDCNEVEFDVLLTNHSSFTIDVGDGTIYTETNFKHTFNEAGKYNAHLSVIDVEGKLHDKSKTIDLGNLFTHDVNGITDVYIYGEHKVIQTKDGGYLYIYSQEAGGPVLTKLDKNGNLLWEKSDWTGCDEYCFLTAIREDANGDIITGGWIYANYYTPEQYTYSVFMKLDPNGNEIWLRTLGDDFYEVKLNDIIPISEGGYLISSQGLTEGTTNLYKTNSSGSLRWQKNIGTSNNQGLRTLLERDNKFYAVSQTEVFDDAFLTILYCLDSDGNMEWESPFNLFGFYSLVQDRDWLRLVGTKENGISGDDETVIYTIDPANGNSLNRSNHGSKFTHGFTTDPLKNQVIIGSTSQGDSFVTKMDQVGTELWTKIIYEGSPQIFARGYDVSSTSDGGYVLFVQDRDLGDMHIVKIDCAGNLLD